MTPRERHGRPGLPPIKAAAGLGGFWAWTKNPIDRTSQAQCETMSLLRPAQFRLEWAGDVDWWHRPPWVKATGRN